MFCYYYPVINISSLSLQHDGCLRRTNMFFASGHRVDERTNVVDGDQDFVS